MTASEVPKQLTILQIDTTSLSDDPLRKDKTPETFAGSSARITEPDLGDASSTATINLLVFSLIVAQSTNESEKPDEECPKSTVK
jgi:hypothetical protein